MVTSCEGGCVLVSVPVSVTLRVIGSEGLEKESMTRRAELSAWSHVNVCQLIAKTNQSSARLHLTRSYSLEPHIIECPRRLRRCRPIFSQLFFWFTNLLLEPPTVSVQNPAGAVHYISMYYKASPSVRKQCRECQQYARHCIHST